MKANRHRHPDLHHDPNAVNGAIDLGECYFLKRNRHCMCEICAICGLRKHKSVHGPFKDNPPGSKPWGHKFIEAGKVEK